MFYTLIAFLCLAFACGYADAKESDLCFRTGKAVEANFILSKLVGPKPSFLAMMLFNSGYQALLCAPWLVTRGSAAAAFGCTALGFRGVQHLTQAYWGMCLNAGKPTPRVDKWWQKFFWQHDSVEG
jgi:hypothetical protein